MGFRQYANRAKLRKALLLINILKAASAHTFDALAASFLPEHGKRTEAFSCRDPPAKKPAANTILAQWWLSARHLTKPLQSHHTSKVLLIALKISRAT